MCAASIDACVYCLVQSVIVGASIHIEMHANVLLAVDWMAILQCREEAPLMKCFEKNLIEPWVGCRLDEFDVDRAVCMDHKTGSCHGLISLLA